MSFGGGGRETQPEPTTLGEEELSTHQEDIPLPHGAGRNLTAGRWLDEARYRRKKEAPAGGKK